MTGFMLLSLGLIILVLWLIMPALLGKRNLGDDDTRTQNVQIARERLSELEQRYKQGDVDDKQYSQMQEEVERALLQDVDDVSSEVKSAGINTKRYAYIIAAALPIIAFVLYWQWGDPEKIQLASGSAVITNVNDPHQDSGQKKNGQEKLPSVDEMARLLENKLKKDPDNARGWYMLARTYMTLRRYDDTVQALRKVRKLAGDNPTVLLGLADALTMSHGGKVSGEPFTLIYKVLTKDPDNITGLWLAGLGYREMGKYQLAIQHWQRLLPLVQSEPQSYQQVQSLIAQTEQQAGLPASKTARVLKSVKKPVISSSVSIKVRVSLDSKLQHLVSPQDSVLVFAKATQGPPMPLAVVKKQVKDLPFEVILDDSMAMQPAMKLSNFGQVNIVARISKSGQAGRRAGDIQGRIESMTISKNHTVNIKIDTILN